MALAVLAYALMVVILYITLDIVLPSSLRKRHKRPNSDMAHERGDE
jgi:hypothetical protein